MISKQSFIVLMYSIQQQMQADRETGASITKLGDTDINNTFVFTTPMIESVIGALKSDTKDINDDISYFIYETDFGRKADEFFLTFANGREVKFYDSRRLYDWLKENYKG